MGQLVPEASPAHTHTHTHRQTDMAERRKPSAKKLEKATMTPKVPMSVLEKSITSWMKENVPTKKTKFLHSHVVQYFIGKKAVDMLTEESPWSKKKTQRV